MGVPQSCHRSCLRGDHSARTGVPLAGTRMPPWLGLAYPSCWDWGTPPPPHIPTRTRGQTTGSMPLPVSSGLSCFLHFHAVFGKKLATIGCGPTFSVRAVFFGKQISLWTLPEQDAISVWINLKQHHGETP